MPPIITLLTDFGTADSYVAEVKAVLISSALGAALIDVTHEIPPGNIRAAQFILSRAWHRFPRGTVHCVVVDPGVGTERRALAAVGDVIYLDRFGTLVTNIAAELVEPGSRVRLAGTDVGSLRRTFGDVERGQLLAYVGSGGTVEIAVRDGSAARLLGVGVGTEVRV